MSASAEERVRVAGLEILHKIRDHVEETDELRDPWAFIEGLEFRERVLEPALRAYAAERLSEAAKQLHVEADQRYPAGKHDEAMGFRKAANAVGALAEREARGE